MQVLKKIFKVEVEQEYSNKDQMFLFLVTDKLMLVKQPKKQKQLRICHSKLTSLITVITSSARHTVIKWGSPSQAVEGPFRAFIRIGIRCV